MNKRRLATIATMIAVVALAVYGTFAAWTATTTNPGNSIESGTVNIADDDSGQAMFDVTNLEPGDSMTRCITVTNTGSTDFNSVKLYGDPASGDLAYYLDMTVDRGTGSVTFPGCSGFSVVDAGVFDDTMDQFPTSEAAALVESGNPATGWAAGASKVYRITVTLPSDADPASAGESTSFGLVWKAEVN